MNHFVCTGECGGVSDHAGVCQDPNCSKHGQPLIECNCETNEHEGAVKACKNCGELCAKKGGCAVEEFKPELEA